MIARCRDGEDTGLRSHSSTMRIRATAPHVIASAAPLTPRAALVLAPGRGIVAAVARSHGSGAIDASSLAACGAGVCFEPGALVFHPENVEIGDGVYVGHYAILKGYYRNRLTVGSGSWIGQLAFLHAAGGLHIGRRVGIGPGAKIITSSHQMPADPSAPIMDGPIETARVILEDGCDIGVGAVILPGVTVGAGAQVGAGAVVTRDVAPGDIVAGSPARVLGSR